VLVVGEIRRGIERRRVRDVPQARVIEAWLQTLLGEYTTRILPVDLAIAERWGRITAGTPIPTADALLAATALEHDLIVATRSTRDFHPTTVATVNPWEAAG
jgi:toxin FitB